MDLHALVKLPGGDHGDDLIRVAENPAPRLGSLTFVVKDHGHLHEEDKLEHLHSTPTFDIVQ